MFDVANLLGTLMPFAGHQQNIAGFQQIQRLQNRRSPIRLPQHLSCSLQTGHDISHDSLGILMSRVVRSQHGNIRKTGHGLAHERPLGAIPITPTAENRGTGPVRGFAVTLTLGILASMYTAIFVSRTLFGLWMRGNNGKSLSI